MPKTLSDTQRVLITNAAKRPSLRLLPPPKSLAKNAGTIAISIKSMLKSGLAESVPALPGDTVWPTDSGDEPTTLVVTAGALAAVGIEPPVVPGETHQNEPPNAGKAATASTPRANTKLAILIDLLKRPKGATLVEIATVTNWQHHSIRGAISGALKKKLGLSVTSEAVQDRGRVYQITPDDKPTAKTKRSAEKSTARQSASS